MAAPEGAKATRIRLWDFRSVPMRTFHITWFTFFICFFAWFGIAPLMPVVREDLQLTPAQIGNIIIGSVSITLFARLFFGWLCDRIGPRRSYTILLALSAVPVMGIGFSDSYEAFLLFRLAIGISGASFVITQYHTSAMFAPGVVGMANATAAGWGNMGGGVALMVMPFVFATLTSVGYLPSEAWRLSMLVPGGALLLMAVVYYFFTSDSPAQNAGVSVSRIRRERSGKNDFFSALKDRRVWILLFAYGASFGIEITIDNIATLYFIDTFDLGLKEAGIIAGLFGMMNLFARTLGGIAGDRAGERLGLRGRFYVLALFLFLEGVGITIFASAGALHGAVISMLAFALFLKMANGAAYAIVPFVNTSAVGTVSGIVGAGGNAGAILAGFLLASSSRSYSESFLIIGAIVTLIAFAALAVALWKKVHVDKAETRSNTPIAIRESAA